MKSVKVILIAVEIASLLSIISLAFCDIQGDEQNFFKSLYISVLSVFTVVIQREQQAIEWNEEEDCYV